MTRLIKHRLPEEQETPRIAAQPSWTSNWNKPGARQKKRWKSFRTGSSKSMYMKTAYNIQQSKQFLLTTTAKSGITGTLKPVSFGHTKLISQTSDGRHSLKSEPVLWHARTFLRQTKSVTVVQWWALFPHGRFLVWISSSAVASVWSIPPEKSGFLRARSYGSVLTL